MTKEFKLSDEVYMLEGQLVISPHKVKEFIKRYENDIEDCVIIKIKDVPKHMVGIDLTWLDREIGRIKDRLKNKLKERAGDLG